MPEFYRRHPDLIVFCSHSADIKKSEDLSAMGHQIIRLKIDKSGFLPLPEAVEILFKTGLTSLMVEGGPKLIHTFLSMDLWDLAVITMAPFWMGGYGLDHYEFKRKDMVTEVTDFPDRFRSYFIRKPELNYE